MAAPETTAWASLSAQLTTVVTTEIGRYLQHYRTEIQEMEDGFRRLEHRQVAPAVWYEMQTLLQQLETKHPSLRDKLDILREEIPELQYQVYSQELSSAKRTLEHCKQLHGTLLFDFAIPKGLHPLNPAS